jgi:hypothetical protein
VVVVVVMVVVMVVVVVVVMVVVGLSSGQGVPKQQTLPTRYHGWWCSDQ